MSEIRTLLFLELRSFYGINQFLHTKDKKAKNRYRGLCLAWILVMGILFFYVGGLVYGLCTLGLGQIVPAYLGVIASLLILAVGLFTAGYRIFGEKGYDLLASMPIRPRSIVISRFLSLYTEDLLFAMAIMLPGVAVYGVCAKPDFVFYLFALLGTVLIPGIPLVISVLFGTFVMAVSARMKRKSTVQAMLMVVLVVGIVTVSFGMESVAENFTPDAFAQLAQSLGKVFQKIYLPAVWLGNAMIYGDVWSLGLFAGVSITVMAVAIFAVSRYFHSILGKLRNFTARHDYKIGTMERRGLLKALYFRELKRYFSSSIYVTNTIIGPILGAIMAVALCVTGLDAVALPGMDIVGLLPFALSAVFTMMTATSVSISMEGKQFWVIKSLPIPTKMLFDSKILLNLTLMAPCYLVAEVAMAIAVKPNVMQLLWQILIPGIIGVFAVALGITVNLKSHSFDWEKEETVVKQSLPALLGGFAGVIVSLLAGLATMATPAPYGDLTRGALCLLLAGLTVFLYRNNNKAKLQKL